METNFNLSFQANVPASLKNTLRNEALDKGPQILKHLNKKIRTVEKWGDKNSVLGLAFDMSKNTRTLSLDNKNLSGMYGSCLPESKKGILSAFMRLKKKDVLNAEKEISELVKNNQIDLVVKALKNPNLMEKIAGKQKPSVAELITIVEKMPESKVCDLRFGLDEFKSDDKILNFNI